MKIFTAVLVLATGTGAWARHAGQTPKRAVLVCLNSGENGGIILRGKAAATQILRQAGIRLEWRMAERPCIVAGNGIVVTISHATPHATPHSTPDSSQADQHPGALAYAKPFERTHIVLFYDRVADSVRPALVPCLLGHVLAHEIVHMLQGFDRHSASGIMKAHWDNRDHADMERGRLKFTKEDIDLIDRGMER